LGRYGSCADHGIVADVDARQETDVVGEPNPVADLDGLYVAHEDRRIDVVLSRE
jgi:hypothetical protein